MPTNTETAWDLPADKVPSAEGRTKSTAELVKFAELTRSPLEATHARADLSNWLSGNKVPSAEGRTKASNSPAGEWLCGLSNAKPKKSADEYIREAKDCYEGGTPPKVIAAVNDKVQYTILNTTHFAVAVKLYGDGSLIAARRVNIADDNTVSYTDTIDFVNAVEHGLKVIDTFPSVRELVRKAVAGYLGSNNGLIGKSTYEH